MDFRWLLGRARVGLVGVSTHSFRRTALTQIANAGIPLRHIQEISISVDFYFDTF